MTEIAAPHLHDFTLLRIVIDWKEKAAAFELLGPDGPRVLTASGLTQIELRRDEPWGPSTSVNVVQITQDGDGPLQVTVEMQTGDAIRLKCAEVR